MDVSIRNAEILEEVLELVRQQQKILNSPEVLFPTEYVAHALRRADREFSEYPAFLELVNDWHEFQTVIRSRSMRKKWYLHRWFEILWIG